MAIDTDRQITISDVAKASRVSSQTVSRVVNNYPYVAESTRERVLASIKKLGYRPNRMARGLVTRSSNTIGIISFGTTYYGPAQTFAKIEKAVRANGYGLTFYSIDELTVEQLKRRSKTSRATR